MKYIVGLIIGSILLGLIATLLSNDPQVTGSLVVSIFYGLGVAITPWVCALFLATIKLIFLRLIKRKTAFGSVMKFDVSVFIGLSLFVHLGLVSLPA